MKYEWMNPQIMSLNLPSDKLTLNPTEFTKKNYRADDMLTIFLVDLTKMMSGQNQGTKLSI
jgi:hypothetical protein